MSKRGKKQKKLHFFSSEKLENIQRDLRDRDGQYLVIVLGVIVLIIIYQFLR